MNPILLETIAKQRHADLMREAKRMQLIALAASEPSFKTSKILAALGELLINAGVKLKQRYACNTELHAP